MAKPPPKAPPPAAGYESNTYAARKKRGMPTRPFVIPAAVDAAIDALNAKLGFQSRSKVVVEGVRLLAAREKIKIDE